MDRQNIIIFVELGKNADMYVLLDVGRSRRLPARTCADAGTTKRPASVEEFHVRT
jgi:hypothetical protein